MEGERESINLNRPYPSEWFKELSEINKITDENLLRHVQTTLIYFKT